MLIFFLLTPLQAEDFQIQLKNQARSQQRPTAEESRRIAEAWAAVEADQTIPIFFLHTASSRDSAYLRQAASHLELARETLEAIRESRRQYAKELAWIDFRQPVWWIKQDELDRARRAQKALASQHQGQLVQRFQAVFGSLDQVHAQATRESPVFERMVRYAERQYAIHQLLLGNYAPAASVLERYARRDGTRTEWPLQYYLHLALNGLYNQALNDRAIPERNLQQLRKRKNEHVLLAVELKFGTDSPEYRYTREKIRLEELGPPRPL